MVTSTKTTLKCIGDTANLYKSDLYTQIHTGVISFGFVRSAIPNSLLKLEWTKIQVIWIARSMQVNYAEANWGGVFLPFNLFLLTRRKLDQIFPYANQLWFLKEDSADDTWIISGNYKRGKYIIQHLSIEMFANTCHRDCDNKWNPLKEGIFICVPRKAYSLNMDVKSSLLTSK